jgi:formylglycine-generating enzyme required for sulfatase activity
VSLEKVRGPEGVRVWTVPDLDLQMMPIRPGTFALGSEKGNSIERPVTQVTITGPYWLGRNEVTQSQFEAIMKRNPATFKGKDRPVEQVSWDDAMEFCRKLTERERAAGSLPAGYAYTLPTEAQWEYACRAGTTADHAGSLEDMGWYDANSAKQTHPVGEKQPNAWGLCDMHGNVWEWCRDWYGSYPGGSVQDYTGPASGTTRVFRGGSWNGGAALCRSAFRNSGKPDLRNNRLGFRIALTSSAR